MGISRDSRHKRRATGGRMPVTKNKRKYEMGRAPAMTKLGTKRIRPVRCRGGNMKYRALRLDHGNYSWGSENISRKCRIVAVSYSASSNELVRTNTLVKNMIVHIDATPFKQWYQQHYGMELGVKKHHGEAPSEEAPPEEPKAPLTPEQQAREAKRFKLDAIFEEQFTGGKLLAAISSRPGQVGRADGFLLEGRELEFYKRKLEKKKKGK